MKDIELWQGDCLELMNNIPNKSVDMIFTDLPYSTTQNSWDCMINLDELWKQYKRIIKKNGCIALWAQAPFSHVLALSNLSQYRYEWIIEKTKATGHLNARKCPMKAHENKIGISGGGSTQRYPRDVLQFKWDTQKSSLHPCQKPLEACEYFIKTYTDEGDVVLDSCMGSNTTGLACKNLKRRYIGIEKDADIFKIAEERMKEDV